MHPKTLLKQILPHGLVRLLQARQERGYRLGREALAARMPASREDLSHEAMVDFLVGRGLRRDQVTEGSMPAASLAFLGSYLAERCSGSAPVRGLHIGNFVGVSLTSLAGAAVAIHRDSVVVGIDPNLAHRGIGHPQDHVCALLEKAGLASNVLLVCGFSRGKNIGDDGRNYLEDYRFLSAAEVTARTAVDQAPHGVIDMLGTIGAGAFDFALIDGNHEAAYVADELASLKPLLRRGALVFLDDVSEGWPMLKQLFERSAGGDYRAVGADGRVGVLELGSASDLPA